MTEKASRRGRAPYAAVMTARASVRRAILASDRGRTAGRRSRSCRSVRNSASIQVGSSETTDEW